MKHFLFIFLDGVGLGENNREINPFVNANTPCLNELLDGEHLIASTAPHFGSKASLLALDACLGVPGLPQSATGQAALLTGKNVPASLGYHYGPKPNQPIADLLNNGTVFSLLRDAGLKACFLNAYPPRYFEAIESGKRLYSAIPLAAKNAGVNLRTQSDLIAGSALSADFTGRGWFDHLNIKNIPVLSPVEAGYQLARLAATCNFSFFEVWMSDYAGHRQDMPQAIQIIELIDQVIEGTVSRWDDEGLILVTSDHGNMEDLSTRRHTYNPVPALLIGPPSLREQFSIELHSLTGIAPAIFRLLL